MLVRRKTETSLPCKTRYNLRWEAGGVPILSLRQAGGSRTSLNSFDEEKPADFIPLPSVAERSTTFSLRSLQSCPSPDLPSVSSLQSEEEDCPSTESYQTEDAIRMPSLKYF